MVYISEFLWAKFEDTCKAFNILNNLLIDKFRTNFLSIPLLLTDNYFGVFQGDSP